MCVLLELIPSYTPELVLNEVDRAPGHGANVIRKPLDQCPNLIGVVGFEEEAMVAQLGRADRDFDLVHFLGRLPLSHELVF